MVAITTPTVDNAEPNELQGHRETATCMRLFHQIISSVFLSPFWFSIRRSLQQFFLGVYRGETNQIRLGSSDRVQRVIDATEPVTTQQKVGIIVGDKCHAILVLPNEYL